MTPNAQSAYEVHLSVNLLTKDHYGANLTVAVNGTPQRVACVGVAWGKVKDRKARFTTVSWSSFTTHATMEAAAIAAVTWLKALPTAAGTATIRALQAGGSTDAKATIANCALVSAEAQPQGVQVFYSVRLEGGELA